jgi:type IV secretory pathway TraG/TraD family ATPase VirD4
LKSEIAISLSTGKGFRYFWWGKIRLEKTEANRINADLARWSSIESLGAKKGSGFSIEKALKDNAVVYVQGGLDDSVLKTATKLFIIEMIQEGRRLEKERSTHLTAVIDEVSFLTSKTLAQALATTVGFRVNFVLAYQSQNDLFNIESPPKSPPGDGIPAR